ncbi:MAG: hypothetical protein FJX60_08690 [Alphaproteobacteria bacterium]|nr:hypothetical protein [Alphaproteobacteria bacterium]
MTFGNLGRSAYVLPFVVGLGLGVDSATSWAKSALPVRAQEVLALRAAAKSAADASGRAVAPTTATVNGIGGIDTWVAGRPLYCLTVTTDAGERGLYIELKGGAVSALSTDVATMALFASACGAKETELGLHFSDEEAGTVDSIYLAVHPVNGKRGGKEGSDSEDDDGAESKSSRESRVAKKGK